MSFTLKKFESQNEVDEKKRRRQEEWEKVRKPEDPVEVPEVPVDNRCLFDKLEEQKQKKQDEIDERFALKNQVKGLDEDESQFLEFVADRQMEILKTRKQEETDILSEMKDAQVNLIVDKTSKQEDKRSKPAPPASNKRSQMSLLAKAVKRKGSQDAAVTKKHKEEDTEVEENKSKTDSCEAAVGSSSKEDSNRLSVRSSAVPVAKVIAIRPAALSYMQQYEDSSDSISSSSDSEPDFSLASRASAVNEIRKQIAQHQQQQQ